MPSSSSLFSSQSFGHCHTRMEDTSAGMRREMSSAVPKKKKAVPKGIGSNLIPIMNKLQDILQMLTTQLDLPQIIVVGGQSSGKSSVLEALVGHDFLPRGAGIVTRRPIILQLNKEDGGEEWGEFAHLPNRKFFDFDEVRQEILNETERLLGTNMGISKEPILLRVFSPHVIPLTLIDTPGLTRVPVGDQPKDIEMRVRELIMSYISQPNAIILAIHSATQDLATSEALKIAREVDPEGRRTIGVLTKLDLMDRGTDASRVLLNEIIPLHHGYVGVVSRSQQDLNDNKSLQQSLKDSQIFFARHPIYRHMPSLCGFDILAGKCSAILTQHIKNSLPQIRQQVRMGLTEMKEELASYGEGLTYESEKRSFLLQTFSRFSSDFEEAVNGNVSGLTTDVLSAGARIRFLFYESFVNKLQGLSPTEDISISEYRTAIRNAAGPRPALFIPDAAFFLLVKQQIERLRAPSLDCADLVLGELVRIVTTLETKELKRFHALRVAVVDITISELQKRLQPTKKMINHLIDMELAYINTNHPDFFGGTSDLLKNPLPQSDPTPAPSHSHPPPTRQSASSKSFFGRIFGSSDESTNQSKEKKEPSSSSLVPPIESQDMTAREQVQVKLLKMLIEKYFAISVKNVTDYVIKALWLFLIKDSKEELNQVLVSRLYDPELFDSLFEEAPYIQERRDYLRNMIEIYEKANQVLTDVELRHLSIP